MKSVYAIATLDTKSTEISYIASLIRQTGLPVKIIDTGSTPPPPSPTPPADITRAELLSHHPNHNTPALTQILTSSDRGQTLTATSEALSALIRKHSSEGLIAGLVSIGGSGGTAVSIPCFHEVPLGVPKVMVSTMASGDVGPYVLGSDVTMVYSVADVAGMNVVSRQVLGNAANALAGMVRFRENLAEAEVAGRGGDGDSDSDGDDKVVNVGMTMFGVTTPCCDAIRANLLTRRTSNDKSIEAICFHATGSGGKAMNQLIASDQLRGVIDITTTELCDELFGGVLSAGPHRFDYLETANGGKGIPAVLSLGALDMINFGAYDTLPDQYTAEKSNRNTYQHNAYVTLVRTTPDENRTMAEYLAAKINKSKQPLIVLIPEKGVSIIDAPDMPFYGEEADAVLFDTLEELVEQNDGRRVVRVPHAINDGEFAAVATDSFLDVMERATVAGIHSSSSSSSSQTTTTTTTTTTKPTTTTPPTTNTIIPLPKYNPSPPTATGPRDTILPQLLTLLQTSTPIIGAGAGTGISAKFEADGGADLIIVYNSGRFRMGGHGSLAGLMPFKDANAVMLEMGREILPVLKRLGEGGGGGREVPLLAGVCATDPFRDMDHLLSECTQMGFAGVQNFPTVGLIDGNFRTNLEQTGMSYDREVQMIRIAREKYGLLTTPYVFDETDAVKMAGDARADIIVAHLGLTTGGSIGSGSRATLDDAVGMVQRIADAARGVNPDVIVLCHGGPVAMPEDAEYVLRNTRGVHGFYGASSMERLPVEMAIRDQMKKFKGIRMV